MNNATNYYEYISSDEWVEKAEQAKARAGYRCQLCNKHRSEISLNAHHRTYERLGKELPEDITVLCRECHAKFHNKETNCNLHTPSQTHFPRFPKTPTWRTIERPHLNKYIDCLDILTSLPIKTSREITVLSGGTRTRTAGVVTHVNLSRGKPMMCEIEDLYGEISLLIDTDINLDKIAVGNLILVEGINIAGHDACIEAKRIFADIRVDLYVHIGPSLEELARQWPRILNLCSRTNPQTKELLNSCKPLGFRGNVLYLAFNNGFAKDKMEKREHMDLFEQSMRYYFGVEISVRLVIRSFQVNGGIIKSV